MSSSATLRGCAGSVGEQLRDQCRPRRRGWRSRQRIAQCLLARAYDFGLRPNEFVLRLDQFARQFLIRPPHAFVVDLEPRDQFAQQHRVDALGGELLRGGRRGSANAPSSLPSTGRSAGRGCRSRETIPATRAIQRFLVLAAADELRLEPLLDVAFSVLEDRADAKLTRTGRRDIVVEQAIEGGRRRNFGALEQAEDSRPATSRSDRMQLAAAQAQPLASATRPNRDPFRTAYGVRSLAASGR